MEEKNLIGEPKYLNPEKDFLEIKFSFFLENKYLE